MTNHVSDKARAREDLCRFLSACYYEPTTDFSDAHLFDSMLAAAMEIHPELAESARELGDAFLAQDIQALLVDYTALFIGPSQPKAMPYASFWLADDQSMRQDATTAVLQMYDQGGFEVDEEVHELPDHIAIELEFLYALMFRINEVTRQGGFVDVSQETLLVRTLVNDHLGNWIPQFSGAIQAQAETKFYMALADLTERFIQMEIELNQ